MEEEEESRLDLSQPLLMMKQNRGLLKRKKSGHSWILYSLGASIIFTICNLFLVELSKEGLYGYLYFCYGTLVASILFFTHRMSQNY